MVLQVLWRRKLNDCSVAGVKDFITKHKGFKHPSHVLRPTVSLYCLTRHEAVFVETEVSSCVDAAVSLHCVPASLA